MKPIFTIHAGEYLVGSEIEKQTNDWEIWLPSRDVGTDLLIRNKKNNSTKTIQVKFSKSWTETHTKDQYKKYFRTQGWWTLNKEKIKNSPADFWIFTLYSFDTSKNDFLIFKKEELIDLYVSLNRWNKERIQTYFWILKNGTAFEGRGLKKKDIEILVQNLDNYKIRNISNKLNNWSLLDK